MGRGRLGGGGEEDLTREWLGWENNRRDKVWLMNQPLWEKKQLKKGCWRVEGVTKERVLKRRRDDIVRGAANLGKIRNDWQWCSYSGSSGRDYSIPDVDMNSLEMRNSTQRSETQEREQAQKNRKCWKHTYVYSSFYYISTLLVAF